MIRSIPLLLVGVLLAADDAERSAPVPDPIGLGERLALIDWLREQGQPVQPGAALGDLRVAYWQRVEGGEREAAAQARRRAEREQLEASKRAAYDAWLRERMAQEPAAEPRAAAAVVAQGPVPLVPPVPSGAPRAQPLAAPSPVVVAQSPAARPAAGSNPKAIAAAHNARITARSCSASWVCDSPGFPSYPLPLKVVKSSELSDLAAERDAKKKKGVGDRLFADKPDHEIICSGYLLAAPDLDRQTARGWSGVLRIRGDWWGTVTVRAFAQDGTYREWQVVIP